MEYYGKNNDKRQEIEDLMKAPILYQSISVVKIEMVREGRSLYGMGRLLDSETAAKTVYPLVARADREMFLVMSLDSHMLPVALEFVSVGGMDSCPLDMRNVFKHAILSNASCLICFHNHPSGNVEPSREDRLATERIKESGELLGIQLADHIILGENGTYYSFRTEEGLNNSEKGESAA